MKIVFMGTPDFAEVILEGLINSRHEVIAVVTKPDTAKDRGKKIQYTKVKELAVKNNIKVLQPERVKGNEEFLKELKDLSPDIIVVAAFGQILTKEILELAKFGCVNVHASLLPSLRGAAPIQWAILEGMKNTGVTIMQMAEGLDTGDMISKVQVEIGEMTGGELFDCLAKEGSELLLETLEDIENGKAKAEKQDDTKATYTQKILKKDGKIDFSEDGEKLIRKSKAFNPWPGLYCDYKGKVMKIWECSLENNSCNGKPGEVLKVQKDRFLVKSGKNGIWIKEIQMPGKKRVKVLEYLKGNQINIGDILK